MKMTDLGEEKLKEIYFTTLEKKLEQLESRSKVLRGVETGIFIGGTLGVASYLLNIDPEATKTMMGTIDLIGEPIPYFALLGYGGGHIYTALTKYSSRQKILEVTVKDTK